MFISDKIQHIERDSEFYFFGQETKNDKSPEICKQSLKQKHMQMSDHGGKVRILQTKNRKSQCRLAD